MQRVVFPRQVRHLFPDPGGMKGLVGLRRNGTSTILMMTDITSTVLSAPFGFDAYWGTGEGAKDDERVSLFSVDIPEEKIKQLKNSITKDLLLTPLEDVAHSVDRHSFIRNLTHVLKTFDWVQHQNFLNTFKQYRTEIEGLSIHFLRVSIPKEAGKDTTPIVLLHGFPGCYWDFYKVIPILANPARFGFEFGVERTIVFDVIVPSLPGFVFSTKPSKAGLKVTDMARIIAKLMNRLSVPQYFVHGSELLGSEIAAVIGALYPYNVRGVHVSNPVVHPHFSPQVFTRHLFEWISEQNAEDAPSTTDEFLKEERLFVPSGDIVGDALVSSVVGTSSYLMSVWSFFSSRDPSILPNRLFTLDELATISYLYFLTETTPHTLRIMRDFFDSYLPKQRLQVRVPSAILQSPNVPWHSSKSVCRHRFLNLTSYTKASKGGVFQHLQDPNTFAADVFRFVEFVLAVNQF
ncbi:hypothetical protein Angca_005411 [Angiostrongylus cantonensis]|nr:hypothetical protein Angca_005411 [Angiostrongylus cantonensis]